jgi:hypothetical protein
LYGRLPVCIGALRTKPSAVQAGLAVLLQKRVGRLLRAVRQDEGERGPAQQRGGRRHRARCE